MASSRKAALRRLREAIDPALDFDVTRVMRVHRMTPTFIDATVRSCESPKHCYPVRVHLRTRHEIQIVGRR